MSHPLAGVVEKPRRSDTHIETLFRESGAYLRSNPYALLSDMDAGNGEPGFYFKVIREPPLALSAIAGDVIHNLRCSLDYLAHELVKRTGTAPAPLLQFPIFTSKDKFADWIDRGHLKGVDKRGLGLMIAVQPYQVEREKWTQHQLWQLQQLSNLDKHRALALSAIAATCSCQFTHPDGRRLVREFGNAIAEDGTVVASVPVDFFHPEMKTEMKLTCQVSFKEYPFSRFEVLNALQRIREFIGELILPTAEPLFGPLPDALKLTRHGLLPTGQSRIGNWMGNDDVR